MANGVGIALGGLLGYAIGHIKGKLASWRYEFIIIGCLCCAWGIVIAILMVQMPPDWVHHHADGLYSPIRP